jgi:hypothetical protein
MRVLVLMDTVGVMRMTRILLRTRSVIRSNRMMIVVIITAATILIMAMIVVII